MNCGGAVDSIDALFILWFDASFVGFLPCPENADVNLDRFTNAIDALFILQYEARMIPALPPPGAAGWGWLARALSRLPLPW